MPQSGITYFVFFAASLLSWKIGAQNLIIIHEYGDNECISNTFDCKSSLDSFPPHGLGAASGMFLIALYQKAAPLLVPVQLWSNILEHKKIFDDFRELKKNELFSRYGKTNRFSSHQKIDEFQGACRYLESLYQSFLMHSHCVKTQDALEKKLWVDPLFDKKNAPYYLKDLDSDLWNEIHLYMLCAHVPIHDYIVRVCSKPDSKCPFYIFFPKSSSDYSQWFHVPEKTADTRGDKNADSLEGQYDTALVPVLQSLLKPTRDSEWVIYLLGHGSFSMEDQSSSTIAGITLDHFRCLLKFLQDHVSTQLLYYSSCSAGGKNFVDPYNDDNRKPITLPYAIISDTLTEAPSSCQCPSLALRYYSDREHYCYYGILPKAFMNFQKTDMVPLKTCYDFSTFFGCARTLHNEKNVRALFQAMSPLYKAEEEQQKESWFQNSLKKITSWCAQIKDHFVPPTSFDKIIKPREITNLASIRMPFSSTFYVVDFYNRFLALPAQHGQKMKYIDDTLDVLFLYTSQHDETLIFKQYTHKMCPSLVSMIPGDAKHEIRHYYAKGCTFSECIQSFFSIAKLQSKKIFCLKQLTCINDLCLQEVPTGRLHAFFDVYIFNRLKKSDEEYINGIVFKIGTECYALMGDHDRSHVPFALVKNAQALYDMVSAQYAALPEMTAHPQAPRFMTVPAIARGMSKRYDKKKKD